MSLLPERNIFPVRPHQAVVAFSAAMAFSSSSASGQEGYYKDLFIDGGVGLTDRDHLAAADMLGLSFDYLASENEQEQNELLITSADDLNGCLLYPDGAPRYRVIQTNGGSATQHGNSLGEEGRQRVRDFYALGGSYTGTCAGAFIAMLHNSASEYGNEGNYTQYYHLWPGIGRPSYESSCYHDIIFEDTSHPLVQMYPSLSDGLVENVRHNYGCRLDPAYFTAPPETEYLGEMSNPSLSGLDGYFNIAAYKQSQQTGRVVISCSHPEGVDSGERRDLMAAILSYALDGQGHPRSQGQLTNDVLVTMAAIDSKLGDRQYHYWTVDLPEYVQQLEVELTSLSDDCDLFIAQQGYPTGIQHEYGSENEQTQDESLTVPQPSAGLWTVGVYGDHDVLNGASYELRASWSIEPPSNHQGGQGGAGAGPSGGGGTPSGGAAATNYGGGIPGDNSCAVRSIGRPSSYWPLMGLALSLGLARRRRATYVGSTSV